MPKVPKKVKNFWRRLTSILQPFSSRPNANYFYFYFYLVDGILKYCQFFDNIFASMNLLLHSNLTSGVGIQNLSKNKGEGATIQKGWIQNLIQNMVA